MSTVSKLGGLTANEKEFNKRLRRQQDKKSVSAMNRRLIDALNDATVRQIDESYLEVVK